MTRATTLRRRRTQLARHCDRPIVLWSGASSARNFPHNPYPFRASSHFLYFAGISIENAVLKLDRGRAELFVNRANPSAALWHGETPTSEELALQAEADAAFPLSELGDRLADAATIPVQDAKSYQHQSTLLQRPIHPDRPLSAIDREAARAIVAVRSRHDEAALVEMCHAARVTVAAHLAGMAATATATREYEIRAAMEYEIARHHMRCAYPSIVTTRGDVLHNNCYDGALQPGDLLLADVGAETASGWAADVTRTWPVSGTFSTTQRDVYDVVLAAHDAAIAAIAPGVEYRDIHLLAARVLAEGCIDLGLLRGDADGLVERDAHTLFFPHGIGHLLGLDVHDMEDLGDLAGYALGRTRSDRFGLGYLRLDRPLQAGMVVTIEPGFYQVPTLLNDPERRSRYRDVANWERLDTFRDARGIRIEDDVWVTPQGHEVLTAALPATAATVQAQIA
ncbi:MAG: aminopeptidase P family protein [Cyanobacteria bacterium J06639_1]